MVLVLVLTGCPNPTSSDDDGANGGPSDPLGPTEGRPGIPMPDTYEGAVPARSDIVVVDEAPAQSFNPVVTAAFNTEGVNLNVASVRVQLIDAGEVVAEPAIHEDAQALPDDDTPTLQLIRYWIRLGEAESYAGGAEQTRSTTTTTGTSTTSTQTFTETLSIEAEASGGGLFASASVTASSSFTATQGFSSTQTVEEEVTKTFTVSPRSGTNLLYSVWQLIEEVRYVNGTGPDASLYDVQGYEFDEQSVRFVYATAEIVPISAYYEQ
jgi:hypothetical protein